MIRKALIIHCSNTPSGRLPGPASDNSKYRSYLKSSLGGHWDDDEIMSLSNPMVIQVEDAVDTFLSGSDYTFIIFSGHGFINTDNQKRQFIELMDDDMSILGLRSDAPRQTLIVDACRGYYSPSEQLIKGLGESVERMFSTRASTRALFDSAVLSAERGWTILFAASEDESALDTEDGAAYLLSLLAVVRMWGRNNNSENRLDLNSAHQLAKIHLAQNFETNQVPVMNIEKRATYFPFAVKFSLITG